MQQELQTISGQLTQIARAIGSNFSLNGTHISYEDIFLPTGLLAPLARRADQLCSLCLGYGLGVSFEEDTEATTGAKVIFDDSTPNLLRILCLTDVLYEIIKGSRSSESVALDELMYD